MKDLQYEKDNRDCRLDLYRGADSLSGKPIIIFIHGGAWRTGNKSLHAKKGIFFASEGFIFVSVEYTLFPQADYRKQAGEIAQAIRWMYDNGEKYGGDKNSIILMGHSAGGHLAALVSTDETYLQSASMNLTDIKETILLDSAGLDIPLVKRTAPTVFNSIYLPVFGNDPVMWEKASPIEYVAENRNIPPFLIIYSIINRSTSPAAVNFHNELTECNIKNEIMGVNVTHKELNDNIGNGNDEITAGIVHFLTTSEFL